MGQRHLRHLKKARVFILSASLWKKRTVLWVSAALVGFVASGFTIIADHTQALFREISAAHTYLPLIMSPVAFALTVWMMLIFFPGISGSGIPQAIAGRIFRDHKNWNRLLGARVIVGKVILTLIAMMGGAAIGREGPTVQVGAAIMMLCVEWAGLRIQPAAILAGTAAGVAAAFNTPLAGIVFAIEELARAFEHRNSSMILTAIVISGVSSLAILGNYTYFGQANVTFNILRDLIPIITIGIMGGIFGAFFAKLVLMGIRYFGTLYSKHGIKRVMLFAASCGLCVAIIGIISGGATYGTGYESTRDLLLHGGKNFDWWYMPARFIVTTASAISGVPGGIFSPSLSVGAALGDSVASWFPGTPVQGIILLAMVAYFSGVTQAPITAFVIVLEITGNSTSAVPLIATGVIASGVARVICPVSLYHALAKLIITRVREDAEVEDHRKHKKAHHVS